MSLADLIAFANDTRASLSSLPMAAHLLAVVGLIAGLVLWVMGRKVLRPIFCILGAVGGAGAGFFLLAQVTENMFGVPSPYLGMTLGATLGLAAAFMLFRFAVAISTGLALGLAGVLLAAAYVNFRPVFTESPPPPEQLTTPALSAPGFSPSETPSRREQVIEAVRPVAQKVREFVRAKVEDLNTAWEARSGQDRLVLAGSGLGAALAGFLLGLLAPRRSAAIATALVGSAVWLGSAAWLVAAMETPGRKLLDQSAVVWLVIWLVAATLGVAAQITGLRQKKKPAPA